MNMSCPGRGRFLEAILQRTERELAGPGRLGTVDRPVVGGAPGGAAPYVTGRARFTLPREVGTSIPPQGVPAGALAPPAAPPPRAVREGLANLGRTAPREYGMLAASIGDEICERASFLTPRNNPRVDGLLNKRGRWTWIRSDKIC